MPLELAGPTAAASTHAIAAFLRDAATALAAADATDQFHLGIILPTGPRFGADELPHSLNWTPAPGTLAGLFSQRRNAAFVVCHPADLPRLCGTAD